MLGLCEQAPSLTAFDRIICFRIGARIYLSLKKHSTSPLKRFRDILSTIRRVVKQAESAHRKPAPFHEYTRPQFWHPTLVSRHPTARTHRSSGSALPLDS